MGITLQAQVLLTLIGGRAYSSGEMKVRGLFWLLALLVLLGLPGLARLGLAQETKKEPPAEERDEPKETISFDFSAGYEAFSRNRDKALRWKKLMDRFGLAEFHVFPARETGPNLGPPLRIWGNGFGTSLWRDPVTGWALQ